ncbi:unnamed protein product [Meloidogyne enterolobii]|uniref:Uncharacterized protein n=1 Tax=Meloidogyne enterolobii TaxID=390850 RepID=A0ACB0Z333_MELEN
MFNDGAESTVDSQIQKYKGTVKPEIRKNGSNRKEYMKIYWQNNKEKKRGYDRKYIQNNEEKRRETVRNYNQNNREKRREYYRKYKETIKKRFEKMNGITVKIIRKRGENGIENIEKIIRKNWQNTVKTIRKRSEKGTENTEKVGKIKRQIYKIFIQIMVKLLLLIHKIILEIKVNYQSFMNWAFGLKRKIFLIKERKKVTKTKQKLMWMSKINRWLKSKNPKMLPNKIQKCLFVLTIMVKEELLIHKMIILEIKIKFQ